MNKYIIKNCPVYVLMRTATSGTYFNICGTAKGHVECKDRNDCVMKQIVEKCKIRTEMARGSHDIWDDAIGDFANDILDLLQIEGV